MCGISGIINFNGLQDSSKEELVKITTALYHRGPDNQGVYYSPNVCFGHRRLAIIDLNPIANQPMSDEAQEIIVSFNGEIFNHAEIRASLSEKYNFKTNHSDTEVIIYAFKEWGIECVHKFVGQFAIALYDKREETVYLIRDRIGQKPIYYTSINENLYFASEIQALFKSGSIVKEINPTAVYDYLTYLTIKAPETFYQNIYKLEAGMYMTISKYGTSKHQYWNVSDYLNKISRLDEQDIISKTEELIDSSMTYRNVSDAPISFALSGGLDSSLNIFYSKKINPDLLAINISYSVNNQFNEDQIAEQYCSENDIPFVSKKIDEKILAESLSEYLKAQKDVPIGDPNSVLMFILSKMSRELERNVLMVGEGGDEIGGYPKYLKHQNRFNLIKKFPRLFKALFNNPIYDLKKMDLIENGKIVSAAHIHGFTESEKKKFWKNRKVRSSFSILLDTMNEINTNTDDEFLRKITNLEYKIRLPEMILSRIDYPSMAASIEARSPFVDHKLVEFSCSVPFETKMKDGTAKYLLKKIAKNKLPEYILKSPKVGFGQLLTPFLNETLPIWFEKEILKKSNAPIKMYIEEKFLNNMYKKSMKGKNVGFKLWVLYALNYWLESNNSEI
ncbi:MAG: asparagine synthase (glutamine-hydrolyzing) [Flavobacteriales bacterium]|nr:asparagine synthase (glutamine-hydrolyzing) [Flavobacteriales bacterium]